MKQAALTTAILASLCSGAVSAATVYEDDTHQVDVKGRAVGMYYASDDDSEQGDQSYFRIGAAASTQVNEQLYGLMKYEIEFDAKSDDNFDTRLGYAGLGGNWGEVTYGRQYGAYTLVSDFTDVLYEFGADASGTGTDRFGTGKSTGVLKYSGEFNGLILEAGYQLENDKVDNTDGDDATAYGVAAKYALPMGINLGAAYNQGEGQNDSDDAKMTALSVAYDANNIYAALLFTTGENWKKKDGSESDTDYEGYEAVLGYGFGNGFSVLGGYNFLEQDTGGATEDQTDYYTVGAQYKFNKQLRTFAEYKIDNIDGNEDVLAIALRYDF